MALRQQQPRQALYLVHRLPKAWEEALLVPVLHHPRLSRPLPNPSLEQGLLLSPVQAQKPRALHQQRALAEASSPRALLPLSRPHNQPSQSLLLVLPLRPLACLVLEVLFLGRQPKAWARALLLRALHPHSKQLARHLPSPSLASVPQAQLAVSLPQP